MPAKPIRILFETTCTFGTPFTTGIQRVVRNVVQEAERVQSALDVECLPVVFRRGRFFDARGPWHKRLKRSHDGGQAAIRPLRRMAERLGLTAGRGDKTLTNRLRKLLYPRTPARWISNAYWHASGRKIVFGENDVLLLLDETWTIPIWPAVQHARQQGCRVGAVVYDLIPAEFPDLFKPGFSAEFQNWLETMVRHSDFLLTISETVRDRVWGQLQLGRRSCAKPVAAFRLGANLPSAGLPWAVRPELGRLFPGNRDRAAYLAVGTIEPRKNHDFLLDAFELVWRRCPQTRLCIAGRIGWKCREVLGRLRAHPRFGESLFLFHDLSDQDLRFCYPRAKALLSASLAEGFGLPIVEALNEGTPVLASDIPVHREVGASDCAYFELGEPESLARLILDAESNGGPLADRPAAARRTVSWSDSCRDLLVTLLQLRSAVDRSVADPDRLASVGYRKGALIGANPH